MTKEDFKLFSSSQYCDNDLCSCYQVVGGNNLKIKSQKTGQMYCNVCKNKFSVRKGTMFFGLRTPLDKIISTLSLLAGGMGSNAVVRETKVTGDSLRAWVVLASTQVDNFTAYMQQDMHLEQVQIDEFWSYIRKKKENLTPDELEKVANDAEFAENSGDMWTFVAVLPESSFIHAEHTAERTQVEAEVFIKKVKTRSDGEAPFFMSDCWFYMSVLIALYSFLQVVAYGGRGRPAKPKRVVDPNLRYGQVHKKRNEKGKIEHVSTRIVLGDEIRILHELQDAERSKTINTDYVESRNGKYRKDNARLIRRTLCHSKKAIFHKASITFLTQVYNYTRTIDALKVEINPNAALFEKKYQHRTPAMAEGLIDKPLTIKELLCIRPLSIAA